MHQGEPEDDIMVRIRILLKGIALLAILCKGFIKKNLSKQMIRRSELYEAPLENVPGKTLNMGFKFKIIVMTVTPSPVNNTVVLTRAQIIFSSST